jgi:hypothetical protein
MRARRVISLKSVLHNTDDLWLFVMLSDAQAVSGPLLSSRVFVSRRCCPLRLFISSG